ncbi:MAG TPA: tRNA (guanosine(37)-N1)-methyltransferase TrmD [Candidatus Acidoferrales bacterium]|nr:tRNA (guanosine(37)-N1)-methyltransferase TrmD [Candidatus Acidoferrales bacterium]
MTKMRFDLITIFPDFFAGPLEHGILRRARETGIVEVHMQDLRVFTKDRHRTVDDRPFGGGEGMVLKPEPLFEAVEHLLGAPVGDASEKRGLAAGTAIVLLSASGKRFDQETARRFAKLERIILICGRYEGVDERVAEHLATAEISIGDFVLSGGELPAMLIVDAVTRLLPGSLGNEASSQNESFGATIDDEETSSVVTSGPPDVTTPTLKNLGWDTLRGTLDFPHYTRPAEYRGWKVPDVLIGGNHAEVAAWRRAAAIEKTQKNRPDRKPTNNL